MGMYPFNPHWLKKSEISTTVTRIYSRWITSLNIAIAGRTRKGAGQIIIYTGPKNLMWDDQSILVSGCRTSQAAKQAFRWQNSALRLSCFEADWFGTTPCVTETTTPVTRSRLTLRSKIGLILYPFACPARFLFRSGCLLGLQLF
jgi:hypothetical protein